AGEPNFAGGEQLCSDPGDTRVALCTGRAGSREQRLIEERRRRFELWLGHGVASEARLDAIELTGDSIEQLARRGRRAASGGATRQRVTEESLIATVDGAVERFLFCRRCAHEHVARADGRD